MYGSIKLFTGCMYSGKTSSMIVDLDKQKIARKNTVIVKFIADTRYDHLTKSGGLITHDGKEHCKHRVINAAAIADVYDEILQYDVIGIDEAQFYPDAPAMAQKLANLGKIIICAGLNSDSKGEAFPQISKLSALAEELIKCHAICMICTMQADFTKNISEILEVDENGNNYKIGGADDYIAVCRKCMYA